MQCGTGVVVVDVVVVDVVVVAVVVVVQIRHRTGHCFFVANTTAGGQPLLS